MKTYLLEQEHELSVIIAHADTFNLSSIFDEITDPEFKLEDGMITARVMRHYDGEATIEVTKFIAYEGRDGKTYLEREYVSAYARRRSIDDPTMEKTITVSSTSRTLERQREYNRLCELAAILIEENLLA